MGVLIWHPFKMRSFLFLLATGLVCFEGVQGATRSKCYGPQIFFASDAEEEDEPVPVPITIEKNKTLADIPAMTKKIDIPGCFFTQQRGAFMCAIRAIRCKRKEGHFLMRIGPLSRFHKRWKMTN